MSSKLKSIIQKIYLYRFLDRLFFVAPFYSVFIKESFSAFNVSLLLVVWQLSIFLFEVPSGYIADKYDRRKVLIVAQVVFIGAFLSWFLMPNYLGYLIGFALWGLKVALTSGTCEAFVYDSLKKEGQEKEYTKINARSNTFSLVAGIVVYSLGFVIYQIGEYELALVLGILSLSTSIIPLLLLGSSKSDHSTGEKVMFKDVKEGFKIFSHHRELLPLVIYTIVLCAVFEPLDEYGGMFLNEAGIRMKYISVFGLITMTGAVLFSLVIHKFEKLELRTFCLVIIAYGSILLSAAILGRSYSIGFLMFYIMTMDVLRIPLETKIQEKLEDKTRSTFLSMHGFIVRILAFVLFLSFGVIAERWGYFGGLGFLAVIILGLSFVYFMFFPLKGFDNKSVGKQRRDVSG